MSVKQIITAECDAIKCRYEKQDPNNGREVQVNDAVYVFEDTIFHAGCFDELSPHEALQHFRISLTAGDFRPSFTVPTGGDGMPDLTAFVLPAQRNGVTAPV